MHGQPIVDLATGRTVAVETLVRWRHPGRGVLPPIEFLDAAEHGPLTVALGRRVLSESCRLASAWSGQLGAPAPVLHVNVSGRQLESSQLVDEVLDTLNAYLLPTDRLVLELSEAHMPAVTDPVLADLHRLRDRGVRIAVADAGHSSLLRVARLPIDILKIDIEFTAGLGHDPACDAVVRALLSLGDALGVSVIAEGVETPQQAELLRTYGCDTVQGYLYSAPRPEADLLVHLARDTAPAIRYSRRSRT